jgi:hypothetical protein
MKFGEWTKISEQLPSEPENQYGGDYYLATVDNDQVVAVRYNKANVRGKEVFRWEYNGRISPWDIIAYMPYPEPYKE